MKMQLTFTAAIMRCSIVSPLCEIVNTRTQFDGFTEIVTNFAHAHQTNNRNLTIKSNTKVLIYNTYSLNVLQRMNASRTCRESKQLNKNRTMPAYCFWDK